VIFRLPVDGHCHRKHPVFSNESGDLLFIYYDSEAFEQFLFFQRKYLIAKTATTGIHQLDEMTGGWRAYV